MSGYFHRLLDPAGTRIVPAVRSTGTIANAGTATKSVPPTVPLTGIAESDLGLDGAAEQAASGLPPAYAAAASPTAPGPTRVDVRSTAHHETELAPRSREGVSVTSEPRVQETVVVQASAAGAGTPTSGVPNPVRSRSEPTGIGAEALEAMRQRPGLEGVPAEVLAAVMQWIAAGNPSPRGPAPSVDDSMASRREPFTAVDAPSSASVGERREAIMSAPIPERRIMSGEPSEEAGAGAFVDVPATRPGAVPFPVSARSNPAAVARAGDVPVRVHIGSVQVRIESPPVPAPVPGPVPVPAPAPPAPGVRESRAAWATGGHRSSGLHRLRRHYLLPH